MKDPKFKIFTSPIETKLIMKQGDGTVIVPGYFTSDRKDEAGDIIERSGTERAIEKYRRWGNVRYMHLPRPVGKVVKMGEADGLEWNQVHIHVIDPEAVFAVENGLLTALSVGIYFTWEDFEFLEEGGLLIHDYLLAEISLVDHPANYDASLSAILKNMAKSMGMQLVPQEEMMEEVNKEKGTLVADTGDAVLSEGGVELNNASENAINIEHEEELQETEQEALLETTQEESQEVEQEEVLDANQEESQEVEDETLLEAEQEEVQEADEIKTVVPYKDTGKADKGESWSKPALKDFTSESFEDLSSADRRRIAGHYTWSANMPPETFGDLKLPHHKASTSGIGAAVWRGVAAAMARLRQSATQIPANDKDGCYNHLAKHYRQFDEEPPEKDAPLTDMELELLAEYYPMTVEDDVDGGEEVMEEEESAPITNEKQQPDPLDELRQEVQSLRSALEIVEKALKDEGRPDESKDAEIANLRKQLEEAQAENKSLQEELEALRIPAERKGKVQETESIPDPEPVEEEEKNIPQPGESKLKFAVRRHLQTKVRQVTR